jgi:hypothetical protein
MKDDADIDLPFVLSLLREMNDPNELLVYAKTLFSQNISCAFLESLRVDIGIFSYVDNVQRILNLMEYDKIEAYKKLIFCKLKDGVQLINFRNFRLADDTGNCFELAIKSAVWLTFMYPDNTYNVVEDKKRPSNWNHFYIFDEEHDLVIDPTKNRIGPLSETGQWDKSNVVYRKDKSFTVFDFLDENYIADITTGVSGNFYTNTGQISLPLIGPRHFAPDSNIMPFGVTLNIYGKFQCPVLGVKTYDGQNIEHPIHSIYSPKNMVDFFQNEGIDIPLSVVTRVLDMWTSICLKKITLE